ncbi:7608_t:CDS:2 [Ambispora gerdemannii]|uniref:7608_t:CDS:1 n=1 Tax=Ambispora gerdemannii TaxID=144530 RepID=A0A9N8YN19_9GLOM|nr:7608_t:CDS:2 [Ambispora gerdemannii]
MATSSSDPNIQFYQSKIEKAIQTTNEELDKWKKFETDHLQLKNTLVGLAEKREYSIMVMALLGDNWFTECSTKHAVEIVDRRCEYVNQNIQNLETQLNDLINRLNMASSVLETKTNVVSSNTDTFQLLIRQTPVKKSIDVSRYENEIVEQESAKQQAQETKKVRFADQTTLSNVAPISSGIKESSTNPTQPPQIHPVRSTFLSDNQTPQQQSVFRESLSQKKKQIPPSATTPTKTPFPGVRARDVIDNRRSRVRENNNNPVRSVVVEKEPTQEEINDSLEYAEDELLIKEVAINYYDSKRKFHNSLTTEDQSNLPSDSLLSSSSLRPEVTPASPQKSALSETNLQQPLPRKISRFKAALLQGKLADQ